MAGQSIESAFASIINDCKAIAAEATKDAAKRIQKDVEKESYRYLAKYYASYSPTMYQRTKSLHKAITPIFEDNSSADSFSFTVGVKYDAGKLDGVYHSNSWYHQSGTRWISRTDGNFDFDSQNNGIPEPWWILDNFLEGIHPNTNETTESTHSLMKKFFNTQLPKRVKSHVYDALFDAITRRL